MDAPGRLNDEAADKALRELFREAGPLRAPDELDERILAAIQVPAPRATVQARALVPRWLLITGAAALLALALLLPSGNAADVRWTEWIPSLPVSAFLTSRWFVMALITGAGLFALETWLGARTLVSRHR